MAADKYIYYLEDCKDDFSALELLIKNNLKDVLKEYDPDVWRKKKYWNEKINKVLKHCKPILDDVYHFRFK